MPTTPAPMTMTLLLMTLSNTPALLLLGGGPYRRLPVGCQQRLLACPGGRHRGAFDMAVAADRLRNAGDLDGECVIVGAKVGNDPANRRSVVDDELALAAALRGMAEGIERRAPQPAQAGERPEHANHPGAESDLARCAAQRIASCQERRGEMEPE